MSKKILNKRRHLTVTASSAIMATAMLAAPSQAQIIVAPGAAPSIITDSNLDTVIQAHIVGGDLEPQVNTGNIDGDASSNATITNDGNATGTFENNLNSADAEAFGNRDGVGASLATIGSGVQPDDGIALSAVSSNEDDGEGFGGSITAHADNADMGFIATDFTSGSVDVSGNSVTATAVVNLGSGAFEMAITGSEPTGYTGIASTNASVVTDLYNDATNYAELSGTLLISSVQEATSVNDSEARADSNLIEIDIDRTGDNDVTGSLTLDDNTISADYTGNDRAASIGIAADDANSAVTAAISTVQYLDANTDVGEDSSASATDNNIEGRVWTDNFGNDTTRFVGGSLSVSGNDIASSATGNRAVTDITLADGLAYNTAAGNNATAVIDPTDIDAFRISDVQVSAGLVGANNQLVENGVVDAYTGFNNINADVQSMVSSSIEMTGNRTLASATGNTLVAGIASGDSSATFDASAALVSRQELSNVLVDAQLWESDVETRVGYDDQATFVDSQITLDQNVTAASATGNKARQDLSLSATTLTLGGGEDGAYLVGDLLPGAEDQNVYANGAVVIANAQFNSNSDVNASNDDADLRIDTGDNLSENATNTQTAITNGVQQAFAAGSDAGNSLALNGVDVGTGAGISNLQGSDALSDVSAFLSAEAEIDYDWDITNASATIADNEQSAIAKGAVAANTLVVDAQTIGSSNTADDSVETVLGGLVNIVDAAYGIANTQGIQGDVTAVAEGNNDDSFDIDVWGSADSATLTVVDNSVLAQAQGVVATNGATLNVGTLNSFFGEDDMAVSNLQIVSGSDILANASGFDEYVSRIDVGNNVISSELENSRNDIIASAESARATNSLTVDATDINTNGLVSTGRADAYVNAVNDGYTSTDAMFSVANTQIGTGGTVTATLRDDFNDGNFYDSATVYTNVGTDVTDSSVVSNDNLLQALAAGNKAFNTLDVASVTSEDMNSALVNNQVNGQDVTSLIGYAGSAGTDGTPPFTVDGTVTTGVWNGNILGLTADQKTAFVNQYSSQGGFTYDAGTGDVSFTSVGNGFLQLTVNGTDPTAGTRLAGGVLVDVFDDVFSSSINVDGNDVQGSALGNAATNVVTVDVTSLDGNDGTAEGRSWTDRTGSPEALANADTTLASTQVLLAGSSSTTDVVNLFGIDVQTDNVVSDSELSVSNNTQFGEAIGNTVANSLTVSGTDLTNDNTSGSLVNSQDGVASVDASSVMEVFANAVSSSSNIVMDGNSNTALAVVNNATNTLTSESTNSGSTGQAYGNSWADNGANVYANGSFVLANAQNAGGTLNSDATTNVYNVEELDSTTTGLASSSVSQSSNNTRAEATANRSANTMTLAAGANLGSTGALVNQQNSSTTVNANATSNITLGLNGTVNTNEAADASSISIEGNTTLALARGNSASNTLNYTAGANYTAVADHAYTDPQDVYGNAAVLNDQVNTGSVNATATGSTQVALNGLNSGAGGSVLNSSVTNSNNTVAAYAYGNSASNSVMLSALNTGTANAAIGNQQLNTGAVTATATSVSFTMSSVGTVSGASMQNNGNAASAVAVGNSSVSFIGAQ